MLNFDQKKVYKGHKNNKSTHRRLWRPRRSLSKHTSSGGFQPPQHQVEPIFILCPFDCCGGRRPPLLLLSILSLNSAYFSCLCLLAVILQVSILSFLVYSLQYVKFIEICAEKCTQRPFLCA